MSFENPTQIQLGMRGEFVGIFYRVAGRLVMSMEEAGETYYWNEFHLVADDGTTATLVHEETERGAEYRMFVLFEPSNPITAAEAADKRLGDVLNIDGKSLRVTCVDESRVCFIEGEAPEGVELGDVARYFNAESGNKMIVVSWTGNEVEFYRGFTFPAHAVAGAFGITSVPKNAFQHLSGEEQPSTAGASAVKAVAVVIAIIIAGALWWSCNSNRSRSAAPPKLPKARLAVGKSGVWVGTRYRIVGRAVVENARVGKRLLRHEYAVTSESGDEALLIQGTEKDEDDWLLLSPVRLATSLTPQQAATRRLGDTIELNESSARVSEMSRARVQSAEGTIPLSAGATLYALIARAGKEMFVLRWNETEVSAYRVTMLSEKTGSSFK
jgi:hypothetical protein